MLNGQRREAEGGPEVHPRLSAIVLGLRPRAPWAPELTYQPTVPLPLVSSAAMPPCSALTAASMLRLRIPEVLSCDRVLYLDADLVVQRDISPLFAIDLGDAIAAGCVDYVMQLDTELHDTGVRRYRREILHLADEQPYLN